MSRERDEPPLEEYSVGDDTLVDQERPARRRHSPGPWRVGRKVGRTVYDANDVLIGVMDSVVDARLIAAAPELLEALLSYEAECLTCSTARAGICRRCVLAQALIHRIEGQTPKEGG